MPEVDRRRFLYGATAAATGSALSVLPLSLQKALAAPLNGPSKPSDVKHVVVLMQENRSFDHYFGTLNGVAGFDDPDAITLSSGRSVFYQPSPINPDGYQLPFHLDTRASSAQAIPSTSHDWGPQHAAWNNGAMDNWLPAHIAVDGDNAPYVMGYYTRDDIPFHYALADAFTICDHYHSSVFGPTDPNRLYWMTGTIDPEGGQGGPVNDGREPYGPYSWTTYAERLEAAGVTWKVYEEAGDYSYNVLRYFKQFMDAAPGSALSRNALQYITPGQFEYDAINDRLPAVSWLCPVDPEDEHPNYSIPAQGAAYIASKIGAIAANPDVWAKTVFVLNWDENDGLFDHVVPPTPPAGTPSEFVDGLPIGAGFRTPCIVISPWSAGGYVSRQNFDHTSVLRLLETFTGVNEPNISAWRRQTFGNLWSVLQFGRPSGPPVLRDTSGPLALANFEVAELPAPPLPGAAQHMPHQEPGSRPVI